MPFAAGVQKCRVDADSIIDYAQHEPAVLKDNAHLHRGCLCMEKGVGHRLGADLHDFLAHDGLKRPCRAFHRDTDLGRLGLRILGDADEDLGQVDRRPVRRAQIPDAVAALLEHGIGPFQGLFDQPVGLLGFVLDAVGDCLEPQHQTLKSLQERVVKLAGDALALGHAFLEPLPDSRGHPARRVM